VKPLQVIFKKVVAGKIINYADISCCGLLFWPKNGVGHRQGSVRQDVFMLKKIYDQLFKKSSSPKVNSQTKPQPDVPAAFFQELHLYRPALIRALTDPDR
jgi:hypothetical protein